MWARITIELPDSVKAALIELAKREFRDPRRQAALIISNELERQGLVNHGNVGQDNEKLIVRL